MPGLRIRYTLYPWIYDVYRYGIPERIRVIPVYVKEIHHMIGTESTNGRSPTRTELGRYQIVWGPMSPSSTERSTDPRYIRDPRAGPKASNLTANTPTTAYGVGAYRSQVAGRSSRTNSTTISSVSSSSVILFVICGFHHIIPYQLD